MVGVRSWCGIAPPACAEQEQTIARVDCRHWQGRLIDARDPEWTHLRYPHWKRHREREELAEDRHEHQQLPQVDPMGHTEELLHRCQ
eukprot:15193694-Heterocapsa_arctica.AAC.1